MHPLLVLVGPTASGKSHLALRLAEHLRGEIISCDSVAVFRGLDIGAAKPSPADRALIPHHGLDLADPDQPFTAGDWARHAREALAGITARGRLPIIAGGTGLYLRALLQGLFPAPPTDPALRDRLRTLASTPAHGHPGPVRLHRLLHRLDPAAAARIHPNDVPKAVRAVEVSLLARSPITAQWAAAPRDALHGYNPLQIGLNPPRPALYDRINLRAKSMFDRGLLTETELLVGQYGPSLRPLASLGYAQAIAVLGGQLTLAEGISAAQQGHRNFSKRQLTWFRADPALHWLPTFGDDPATLAAALHLTQSHLHL